MDNEALRPSPGTRRDAAQAALLAIVATQPDIAAAYLFGSVARGDATERSDVDVALLVAPGADPDAVCGQVSDALCCRLRTDRADVVSLRDVPVPVRYRVVRDGLLVACRDRALLERFVTDTVLQYLDFKPLRDRAFQVMRQAILRNG